MPNAIKYLLFSCALALLALGGLFLPERLAARNDQQLLGEIEYSALPADESAPTAVLGLIDRLNLSYSGSGVTIDPYSMWDVQQAAEQISSVEEQLRAELADLQERGLFPALPQPAESAVKSVHTTLFFSAGQAASGVLLWQITLYFNNIAWCEFAFDPASAKVLSYAAYLEGGLPTGLQLSAETARSWADYLGLEAGEVSVEEHGYSAYAADYSHPYPVYSFDLISAGASVGCTYYQTDYYIYLGIPAAASTSGTVTK